jgi:hypothetical protein
MFFRFTGIIFNPAVCTIFIAEKPTAVFEMETVLPNQGNGRKNNAS